VRALIGVDAGGTRTTAALAVEGALTRTYEGGCGNPNVVGMDAAVGEIARCVENVLKGDLADVIVAGVAGAGKPPVRAQIETQLQRRFPASRVVVCNDAAIALRAAIPQGDGIVVIAGTGSIVYAEVGSEMLRAGGEGYGTGDPGSGYAIGLAALPDSAGVSVGAIAAYARTVLRDAEAGDARAAAILDTAANDLYRMIESVALRCPPQTPLAFAGGLLRERNELTRRLQRRIAEGALTVCIVERRVEPYFGALALAAGVVAT
jgi:N-acetylglucosamine kinase-like BadF-type ATPase